jgi:hypothetical protein
LFVWRIRAGERRAERESAGRPERQNADRVCVVDRNEFLNSKQGKRLVDETEGGDEVT